MASHLSARRKVLGWALLILALGIPLAMAHILGLNEEESISLFHIVAIFLPPFATCAFLGFRALFFRDSSPFPALVGSAIGAFLAVAVPYGWAWYRIKHYAGGGADIGLGLILLGLPLYILFAAIIGWHLGNALGDRSRSLRRR